MSRRGRLHALLPGLLVVGCLMVATGEGVAKKGKSATVPPRLHLLQVYAGTTPATALSAPTGLAWDPQTGEVLVANSGMRNLVLFSPEGTVRTVWSGSQSKVSQPFDVAFTGDGSILVSEMDEPVVRVLDTRGAWKKDIFVPSSPLGPAAPGRLEPFPQGGFLVTDRRGNLVLEISDEGKVVRVTSAEKDLRQITGVVALQGKNFLATSARGAVCFLFDGEGRKVWAFGAHGGKPEDFAFPSAVARDAKGFLWVADAFQHRMKVFTAEGQFLFNLGSYGDHAGSLSFPVDFLFTGPSEFLVLEKGANRVQKFRVEEVQP